MKIICIKLFFKLSNLNDIYGFHAKLSAQNVVIRAPDREKIFNQLGFQMFGRNDHAISLL